MISSSMCEILFCFIHLEAITHIDKEQTTTTIINKSNNLQLTNENTEDEQKNKRISMRCTNLQTQQNEEEEEEEEEESKEDKQY
jgi:hypothetical protein